jgi:hypothetical protein
MEAWCFGGSSSFKRRVGLERDRPPDVYHHCREKRLHRYAAEFDFRYNRRASLDFNDLMRVSEIVRGAEGKRLTYRRINEVQL